MSMSLAALEMFVLAFAGCALLSHLTCSALVPSVLDSVQRWEPSRRHIALWLLAAAPVLLTFVCFLALLAPSILSLFMPALDHCLVHDDGHAHLCFVHLPSHAPHVVLWASSASVLTFAVLATGARVLRIAQSYRAANVLFRDSSTRADGVYLLDSDVPLCAAVGLLRPRILISRKVRDGLSESELSALIAHERSHVRRRDALTRSCAHALSWMYPPAMRTRIHQALDLAAEQACDEAAAGAMGDRLIVAEAILRTERLMATSSAGGLTLVAVGMGHVAIEQRVQALIAARGEHGPLRAWLSLMVGMMVVLFVVSDALHHAAESLLSPLLQ